MRRVVNIFLSVVLMMLFSGCEPPQEWIIVPEEEETVTIAPMESTVENTAKEISMDDILLIGDFHTCALKEYGCFPQSDYVCDAGMTVYNVWDSELAGLLERKEYQCVILGLGLNEAGYPISSLRRAFQDLITYVIHTQPQAKVVLQGVISVGESTAQKVSYTCPERLREINAMIAQLARQNRAEYADFYNSFANQEGYLLAQYSVNGCHLNERGTRQLYRLLWDEINQKE